MASSSDEIILRRLSEGPAASAELEQLLGLSQSSTSRLLRDLVSRREVIRLGRTRGARYARLRGIEGIGSQWPLRRVAEDGTVHDIGLLRALAGSAFDLETADSSFTPAGATSGLPYYLQDQRPAGFLGRTIPQRYPQLHLPQRVIDWNDDHYLRYLTQYGSDVVSDLILGDAALNAYLESVRRPPDVHVHERARRYPQIADEVMQGGFAGSSAHGEHPKFAIALQGGGGMRHVLVKFSPPISTPVGERWADLLVAEHLAHQALAEAGIDAANSRIESFADRAYLEIDRFDRAGPCGRVGVSSLFAIDAALYGALDNWIDSVARLHRDGHVDVGTLEQVRLVTAFGALIANTDRHFGNLAFLDRYDGSFSLAPIYDMLPMLFAPEHGQVVTRVFVPPDPASHTLRVYAKARLLAEQYWRRCAEDARISAGFRSICAACLGSLEALPRAGAYAG